MQEHTKALYAELCKRMTYTEIITAIRARVRDVLAERGMPLTDDAAVLFDDTEGRVVVISGKHVWDGEAAVVAQECGAAVLEQLRNKPVSLPAFLPESVYITRRANGLLARGVFWGFNGLVLLYWLAWFVRFVFSADFRQWYETARVSDDFGILGLVMFLLLPLVPLASVFCALWARRSGETAFGYARSFFLFELPALVSVFILNLAIVYVPLTDGLRVFFVLLLLVHFIMWFMAVHRLSVSSARARLIHFGATTMLLVAGVYAVLLTFVPWYISMLEQALPELVSTLGRNFDQMLLDPLGVMMLIIGLGLTLVPVVVMVLIVRSVVRRYRAEYRQMHDDVPSVARGIALGAPVVFVLLLVVLSLPARSGEYEEELVLIAQDTAGYESQAARAQELVDKKDQVDDMLHEVLGARNAYLFEASDFDRYTYREIPITSVYIQTVAFPFIDRRTDVPMTSTRRSTLLKGYKLVYGVPFGTNRDTTVAPLQQVKLLSRDVHALTHGSSAFVEVTVTDSLGTFVPSDQEVVYEFSLPEDAVVTGLRLGASLEHVGQIAPRGAAQQVYTEQVRAMRDPALLEQTGPRQYRLRVYPVPGVSDQAERTRREAVDGMAQRVQYSYIVLRDPAGIPMPVFTEEYNLLTNETKTTVRVDGTEASLTKDRRFIADTRNVDAVCADRREVRAVLPNYESATLVFGADQGVPSVAVPLCSTGEALLAPVQGKNIAILIDTSYANREGVLESALEQLRALPNSFYTNNAVRYVLFSNTASEPKSLSSSTAVPSAQTLRYFGHGNTIGALTSIGSAYDIVVVLSGEKVSDQADVRALESVLSKSTIGAVASRLRNTDVIIVHPQGAVPAYARTFETALTGARSLAAVTDVLQGLVHVGVARTEGETHPYLGSYWYVSFEASPLPVQAASSSAVLEGVGADVVAVAESVSGAVEPTWEERNLRAMVERARIAEQVRLTAYTGGSASNANTLLDLLHARAVELGIVTPISSYIALVNNTQQQRLENLTGQVGRYTNEQSFAVTQPNFASPLGAPRMNFGSTGLTGVEMASVDGGGGGQYTIPMTSRGVEQSQAGDEDAGMLPRVVMLVLVIGLFGAGTFTVYRVLLRKGKVKSVE